MCYILITFDSTHDAMATELLLKGHVPYSIMPTLRSITSACGISIRVELEYSERIDELLASSPTHTLYLIDDSISLVQKL